VVELAWVLEQADYAPAGVTPDAAEAVVPVAEAVRDRIRQRTTVRARLLASVDPRPANRRGPRPTGPRLRIRSSD